MCGEGTVHVEEEGRVRMWCWKGGEESAFDGPVVGGVGGGEPLVEEGLWVFLVLGRKPESRGEGEIDLLEGAVGDVFDGGLEARRETRLEGFRVVLEPTERGGHYDFIEVRGFILRRGDRDWHCRSRILLGSSADGCDLRREL